METYIPGHWSYENHRKLREDFAKGMRDARICVFDSSLERKMIRKVSLLSSGVTHPSISLTFMCDMWTISLFLFIYRD